MSTEKKSEHFEDATCSAPYATATCVSLTLECGLKIVVILQLN